MKKILHIAINVTLIHIFSSFLLAQGTLHQPDNKKPISNQLDEIRVMSLKSDILSDIKSLDKYEQALAFGWLGRTLSTSDRDEAIKYFTDAVEIVENKQDLDKEDNIIKKRRLLTVRKLAELIGNLDPTLSTRLKELLVDDNINNENLLIGEIKTALEKKDKTRAIGLWNEGFARRYKSYEFISLIVSFRRLNDDTADILFAQALKLAPQVNEIGFHQGLAFIVFPELESPVLKKIPVPPDSLRITYLNILSALLFKSDNGEDRCTYALIAVSLLDIYKKLEPSKAGPIQVFTQQCKASSAGSQDLDVTSQGVAATSDELIAKAKEIADKKLRLHYFLKAASKVRQEGDLEKAIRILDMVGDKNDTEGVWDMLRKDYAGDLAIEQLSKNDLPSFFKIINECPEHLVFLVKIRSIKYLLQKNKPLATDILRTLTKDITASPKTEQVAAYLITLELSDILSPTDSLSIFNRLILALNDFEESGKDRFSSQPPNINIYSQPLAISSSFVKINTLSAINITSEIKANTQRLSVRMGILKALIDNQLLIK